MTKQNNALRLADWLDDQYDPDHYKADAATELRRLHAENATLQAGYDAARYRMLRRGQHWSVINGVGDTLRAEELDAAIDAARSQAKKGDPQ